VTGSGPIIAISGTATNLYALQDNGNLYHSTGGAFSLVTTFAGGVKDLHVEGSLIVVLRYRAILFCSNNCTSESAFTSIDLVALGLDAEAACGLDASHLAVVVSDTSSMGQIYEWNGTSFLRTNTNLGIRYPRHCWYEPSGAINIAGENKVVFWDQGAATPQTLIPSGNAVTFFGGFTTTDSAWAAGQNGNVQRRMGSTWTALTTSTTNPMFTVGGPSANEIYAFGLFSSAYGNGFKWNGMTLAATGDILPNGGQQSVFQSILVTGPNEMYVGGQNTSGPVIARGRR
jgi:hypothetical protein